MLAVTLPGNGGCDIESQGNPHVKAKLEKREQAGRMEKFRVS